MMLGGKINILPWSAREACALESQEQGCPSSLRDFDAVPPFRVNGWLHHAFASASLEFSRENDFDI